MNSIFTINNVDYDVSVVSLQREASILSGDNAGKLRNGNVIRDVTGTIYNYTLEIGQKLENVAAYDALYEVLTAPVESYPINVPFGQGQLEFDAYIKNVSDNISHIGGKNIWDKLMFSVNSIEPQRYCGENWTLGVGTGNQIFTIDGVGFDCSVDKLERRGQVLETNNSGRSKSGVMNREIIGTYYNYSMQIEQEDIEQYDRLYYALTAPVDSHVLTIPYGQGTLTFNAYVTQARDNLTFINSDIKKWSGLEIEFMAMAPARR
ncbi:hypothetical protein [Anaerovorax sp. IOR16]|uniref:hypothetical protein n=1 Tax=Anaerovorax sp. IOR16 TaxID=2773458 RepID=UPI0019CFDE9F|nr:hypothetical protein [Anaerovorax sp. IOR16]